MNGNFSTHGIRNTFKNTTSRDDGRQLPPIPQFIYFTSLSLKFLISFPLFGQVFATIIFSALLSPREQVLFLKL